MVTNKTQIVIDSVILGALPVGALAQILPPMAAAVSIVYGVIKTIETDTFKNLMIKVRVVVRELITKAKSLIRRAN
jgi:hypothetical protein